MLNHPDEDFSPLANERDACREYATNVGHDHPDRAWILTPYDTWEPNPCYRGPAVPHPEDYDYDEPVLCPACRSDETEELWTAHATQDDGCDASFTAYSCRVCGEQWSD